MKKLLLILAFGVIAGPAFAWDLMAPVGPTVYVERPSRNLLAPVGPTIYVPRK